MDESSPKSDLQLGHVRQQPLEISHRKCREDSRVSYRQLMSRHIRFNGISSHGAILGDLPKIRCYLEQQTFYQSQYQAVRKMTS